MSYSATEDPNPEDNSEAANKLKLNFIPEENKTCGCQCPANQAKDSSSIKLIPVSHVTFFGPSLDDLMIQILNLMYTLAEKFGLVKKPEIVAVANKKKEEEPNSNQGGVDTRNNDTDIVEWLHDEFVNLSEDLKAANENNTQSNACCCGEGNRSDLVALQARRNVLNQLAEVLDCRNNREERQ